MNSQNEVKPTNESEVEEWSAMRANIEFTPGMADEKHVINGYIELNRSCLITPEESLKTRKELTRVLKSAPTN